MLPRTSHSRSYNAPSREWKALINRETSPSAVTFPSSLMKVSESTPKYFENEPFRIHHSVSRYRAISYTIVPTTLGDSANGNGQHSNASP